MTTRTKKIAILGAGPIGIEAALCARERGYEVDVFEQGRVAEHVRRWGHVTFFSPWKLNRSERGERLLRAQERLTGDDDAFPTPPSMGNRPCRKRPSAMTFGRRQCRQRESLI